MKKQHSQTARRPLSSPLTIDIAKLGRRPGSMFRVQDTVDSPLRIGVELIAIVLGAFGIVITGALDDKYELRPAVKFSGQFFAAALVAVFVAYVDIQENHIGPERVEDR